MGFPGLRHLLLDVSPSGGSVQRFSESLYFHACLFLIAAISVHDAYLVVLTEAVIQESERNPVGRWLIHLHGGEVWLFVAAKLCGTTLGCAVLLVLFEHRKQIALMVGSGVTAFQGCLLCFLTFW